MPMVPLQTKLKDCKIRINEYNFGTFDPNDQFIELAAVCINDRRSRSRIDMKFFKILVLTPLGEVAMMCKFTGTKQFRTRKTWFFVFGGNNIVDRDMPLSECKVNNWLKNSGRYIPDGNVIPHAVILVYNQRPEVLTFLDIKEDGNMKKLSDAEIKTLSRYMQDLYIYGTMTPYVTCDLFMELLKPYGAEHTKIIRDWQIEDEMEDYSVNRCGTDMEAFKPSLLMYSSVTPNGPNNCQTGFQFSIESMLPQLPRARKEELPSATNWKNCYIVTDTPMADVVITEPERYAVDMQYAQATYHNSVPESMEIDDEVLPIEAVDSGQSAQSQFDFAVDSIPNAGKQEFIWSECSSFPQEWLDKLQGDPVKPIDINILKRIHTCFWYEVLPSGNGRCKLCYALHQNGILVDKKQKITKIMKEEGYMYRHGKDVRYINKQAIDAHENSQLHKLSLQYFKNYDDGLRGKQLEMAMLEKGKPYRTYFEPTENLHIIVYQSVKMKLRPYNFEVLTRLLEHFGVKFGSHHNNRKGFKVVLMNIDNMMRRDIIAYLLKTQPEISVTVDTSTDVAGLNSLAVIFQAFIEKDKPKTFFYRLLETKGERGVELFEVFKTAIEADGLAKYIKSKMSGLVTDGCPSMTCTFLTAMRDYIPKGFIFNHCYSHRLELASKNALKNFTMVVRTESGVNEMATFYGPKSPKRRRVLHETAEEAAAPRFELRRIMTIRWVASKNRAVATICQHWKTIVEATESIAEDNTFSVESRKSATAILKLLKDGTFVITLAWLADTTKFLTEVSEVLQTRGTTLIGKKEMINALKGRLEDMKFIYGDYVSVFLNNAAYEDREDMLCGLQNLDMTIEDFETKAVSLFGVALNPPTQDYDTVRLHNNMDVYLTRIITNLDTYFDPNDKANDFDIFLPKVINREDAQPNFGEDVLDAMNNKYEWGLDLAVLSRDWKVLARNLRTHVDFDTHLEDRPEDFWMYYLEADDSEIGWTTTTRTLLRNILSVTATSSEVERIFSMVTNEKTRQRYSLKVETVSALVNINFNGASNLKFFDSFRYAKEFLKTHVRADDDGRRTSKKVETDDEDSFLAIFG